MVSRDATGDGVLQAMRNVIRAEMDGAL